jgi:asparagine synthase (glutamine-hydrolysing)
MCGIAGIVSGRPIGRLPSLLAGFSRTLEHRGPDDLGFLTWNPSGMWVGRDPAISPPAQLALAHRRLSIVDLSDRGWQPMLDGTGRYAIVFNGEIYNYPELRRELEAAGVQFRSDTDTEVLLNLVIRSGIDSISRAVGMFAFALFDTVRRRLWLARDPFGIKPLFYSAHDGTLAFSSEIRPLVELGFAPRLVEPGPLFDYLRHAITDHGERTLVSGVRQLQPAHTMEVDIGTGEASEPRRYWSPTLAERAHDSVESAAEELRGLFTQSVRFHLRADVPVAATLSGGIDSSAIVGTIARLQGASSLATFSYIADDPILGEERYVDSVSRAVGVCPRKVHLEPEGLANALDALILTQEQPVTTTSMWAQRCVFQRVHDDEFKVVIDGQGADELFAGYPVFRSARLAHLIQRGELRKAAGVLGSESGSRAVPFLRAVGSMLPTSLQTAARRLIGRPTMPGWLNVSWFERHGACSPRPFAQSTAPTELKAQLFDAAVATSLPMLLRYADRNAMAVSLENRVPFVTTSLADFALSLPDEFLIGDDGTTKRLLRVAMRGVVPDEVLDRRDKIGFVTPESRWFDESPALRAMLRAIADHPLPPCFSHELGSRMRAVADRQAPYGADIWRCWNAARWAELLQLEFPA